MKQNKGLIRIKLKGLKFNTWLIFTLFASGILIMLWFLQLSLLPPYYRAAKIGSVKSIASNIEVMLINDQPLTSLHQLAHDNSLCIQLLDSYGNVSNFNGIGNGCYIDTLNSNNPGEFDLARMIEKIKLSEKLEYDYLVDYKSEMIVYGKILDADLGRYTLLINTAIAPERVGFRLIQNQFLYLAILVLGFATLASIILANKISQPFIDMTKSARKLAERDFDVDFDAKGINFNEFADLAKSLNYATSELKKVDELRLDLIANVSHDIKTPLTMILAYIEMIQDFSKDDQKLLLEHLEVISSEAKYLDNLAENILELSMLQSGTTVLEITNFNLNELVGNIKDLFEKQDITINIISDQDYFIKADQVKIGQVIYNFISNASKYSQDCIIDIKIALNNDKVRLSVIDYGLGISEEELPYVWDRYYRINKNFYREQEGSGLGLSIARSIIEAHKGHYGVNSELGVGSEFYFEIENSKQEG